MQILRRIRRCGTAIAVGLLIPMLVTPVWALTNSPFCANGDCGSTLKTLKDICELVVKEKSDFPTIYVGGYYMRTLVAGYEIFGDRRYLDTAIAFGDSLLAKQMTNGLWASGYGTAYLADTGSALGLFIVLYKHVDSERQKRYFHAVELYTAALQKDGMIHPNGAFGTGFEHAGNNTVSDPIYDEYTLSSALTGAEIFTWMYHETKDSRYRQVAYNALKWEFSNMRPDGHLPYVIAMEGADWSKREDPATNFDIWKKMTFGAAGYVGEGVLSFDLYSDNPAWKAWIEKTVKPNIDFLLKTQRPDGTWSEMPAKTWDRTRQPTIINYLTWYYEHVEHDPRIVKAVQRFDAFVTNPESGKSYGLLNDGANFGGEDKIKAYDTVTSLTGRALADIISPGVDAKW